MSTVKRDAIDYGEWLKTGKLSEKVPEEAKEQMKSIFASWKRNGRDLAWVEKVKISKIKKSSLGGGG
jgi:hypothetical protein